MTDPEINEAIAQKFGWMRDENNPNAFWSPDSNRLTQAPIAVPDYCHSIAAAWEIVEFLYQKRFQVIVNVGAIGRGRVTAAIATCGAYRLAVTEEADAAPMAICRAFLKLTEKAIV